MADDKPNIVLILADDMGFSDIGCVGSEIRTPHLDRLAAGGLLLTQMYNAARCCPTRAALLTGLYPHKAGIGHMGAPLGGPAYQGHLRDDAVTLAEALKPAGYRTLLAGKWHVGGDYDPRQTDRWRPGDPGYPTPLQRGFDRFWGTLDGAGSFFAPHFVMQDDRRIEITRDDFYMTDAVTDAAIRMVEESVAADQPFFLYLGHSAPHWPLHAHEDDIARYEDVYHQGWDYWREARYDAMLSLGVVHPRCQLSPRDSEARPWKEAPHKDWEARRMAVYAAMIDRMDQQIGRLVATLDRLGQRHDTLILFLSDNGGCAEFMAEDGWAKWYPEHTLDGRPVTKGNRPELRPGADTTFMSYDLPWANLSNAPFRLYKHWVHEGGISTPMIVNWPGRVRGPRLSQEACHVIDIMPTLLEAAGAAYPKEHNGHPIQPLDGESLLSLFEGHAWSRGQPLYWEHEGNAAVRLGQWKLVRRHGQRWELYDLSRDRSELNDRAQREPARMRNLARRYRNWAGEVGVEDWNTLLPRLRAIWAGES